MKVRYLLFIVLISCSNEPKIETIYNVPEKYQSYIELFEFEAAQRGVSLEINNLIIEEDSTLSISICGICNSLSKSNNIQKKIILNPSSLCIDSVEKIEALIFHELGHCVLGRPHKDELLPNGDPKSLMNSNENNIYGICIFPIGNDANSCDNRFKRTYYLDELFNESTPIPDWAK